MNYQDELEKKQREQKREEYIQLLEEERRQKEHEKAEIIKELVKKKNLILFFKAFCYVKKGITEAQKNIMCYNLGKKRQHPTNQHKLFLPHVNQLH